MYQFLRKKILQDWYVKLTFFFFQITSAVKIKMKKRSYRIFKTTTAESYISSTKRKKLIYIKNLFSTAGYVYSCVSLGHRLGDEIPANNEDRGRPRQPLAGAYLKPRSSKYGTFGSR